MRPSHGGAAGFRAPTAKGLSAQSAGLPVYGHAAPGVPSREVAPHAGERARRRRLRVDEPRADDRGGRAGGHADRCARVLVERHQPEAHEGRRGGNGAVLILVRRELLARELAADACRRVRRHHELVVRAEDDPVGREIRGDRPGPGPSASRPGPRNADARSRVRARESAGRDDARRGRRRRRIDEDRPVILQVVVGVIGRDAADLVFVGEHAARRPRHRDAVVAVLECPRQRLDEHAPPVRLRRRRHRDRGAGHRVEVARVALVLRQLVVDHALHRPGVVEQDEDVRRRGVRVGLLRPRDSGHREERDARRRGGQRPGDMSSHE